MLIMAHGLIHLIMGSTYSTYLITISLLSSASSFHTNLQHYLSPSCILYLTYPPPQFLQGVNQEKPQFCNTILFTRFYNCLRCILHLKQCTNPGAISTVQSSPGTHTKWYLLTLLPFFFFTSSTNSKALTFIGSDDLKKKNSRLIFDFSFSSWHIQLTAFDLWASKAQILLQLEPFAIPC